MPDVRVRTRTIAAVLTTAVLFAPVEAAAGRRAKQLAHVAPAPGHTRFLTVTKVALGPEIDGALDEAVWRDSEEASGFWISESQRTPDEQTRVRVIADEQTLYVAFTCLDARPHQIRADQRTPDGNFGMDDHVIVELDPRHNHRFLSRFSVNARGTQRDAMAGGRARKWKGEWRAAVKRHSFGWTAELAIPFEILDYPKNASVFGVNFIRYHSRTQQLSRWADVTTQAVADESGHLTGLALGELAKAHRFDVLAYSSGGLNTSNALGEWQDVSGQLGFDARYDAAGRFTLVGTLNPDFTQIEGDVLGIGFSYNEKFKRDPRPFFQEGAGFFGSRTYFHSGRIDSFDMGLKTFGRHESYQYSALGVVDRARGRSDFTANLSHELGGMMHAGVTIVGTNRRALDNTLIAMHTGGRIGRHMTFGVSGAATSTDGAPGNGGQLNGSVGFQSGNWSAGTSFDRNDEEFFPADGFIAADVLGTRGVSGYVAHSQEHASGFIRRSNVSGSFADRQTFRGLLQRQNISAYGGLSTRNNVDFNVGFTQGPYRPRGAQPGEWLDTVNDDRFYSASSGYYHPSGRFGSGLSYSWGFLGGSAYSDLAPSMWAKPTTSTTVSYGFERALYYGVQQQHVMSASWDMSPEQGISGRLVHYDEPYLRLAYRRLMRKGMDAFAVYNRDPYTEDSLSVKLVWAFTPLRQQGHSSAQATDASARQTAGGLQ